MPRLDVRDPENRCIECLVLGKCALLDLCLKMGRMWCIYIDVGKYFVHCPGGFWIPHTLNKECNDTQYLSNVIVTFFYGFCTTLQISHIYAIQRLGLKYIRRLEIELLGPKKLEETYATKSEGLEMLCKKSASK